MSSVLQPGTANTREARALFERLIEQTNRLLTITTPLAECAFVVEKFRGREAVSELFEFEVECVSAAVHFELKSLIGAEVSVRLRRVDGSLRPFHGFVAEAGLLGADGGLARYRFKLRPWLWTLDLRRDCYVFQDKDVVEIAQEIFADYQYANVRFDVHLPLRKRSLCIQYRETDYAFLRRLFSDEGLSFYFEHLDADAMNANTHAKHRLVVRDRQAQIKVSNQPLIRFSRADPVELDDTIQTFEARRAVQPNAISLSSWDYASVFAPAASVESTADSGALARFEIYEAGQAYAYENAQHAQRIAQLRLAAHELANKTYAGLGAVRDLAPYEAFDLTGHPDFAPEHYAASRVKAQNRFVVLAVEHEAANNLKTGVKQSGTALTDIERGSYRNRFECVIESIPIVPQPLAPPAIGPQTALVVGIEDAPITTERDHRIKLQWPWQRGDKPNPGGSAHSNELPGNAPGNERSGTWVRVAETLAGANYGSNFVPRIGHEVLVDFVAGNIDRPLVVAQVHNGVAHPPYSAGIDSAANHGGTIAGLHTRGLDGQQANQCLVDDMPAQLRASLKTSYATSQFNQGYLIHQRDHDAYRGAFRGTGFELRSDAWGVMRAEAGMLVTTRKRANAVSTQLDTDEAKADLKNGLALGRTLSQSAQTHRAHALNSLKGYEQGLEQIAGEHPASVNGQAAKTPEGKPVERFSTPLMLVDAAADMALATPTSALSHAMQALHLGAGEDAHLSAVQTLAATSGKATSLYSHSGGIKVIAANGPVSIHAHLKTLQVLADRSMRVLSVNGRIEVQANQRITLYAGNSTITLDGSNITFACPGTFSVKGTNHAFVEPASMPAKLPSLPVGSVQPERADLAFRYLYHDGEPVIGAPYVLRLANGDSKSGHLDGDGALSIADLPIGMIAEVQVGSDARPYQAFKLKLNPDEDLTDWLSPSPSPLSSTIKSKSPGLNSLIEKSPTLKSDLDRLRKEGWRIDYGPPGGGSYTDRSAIQPSIILDSDLKAKPAEAVSTLSHEVGHALYEYKPDMSSKAAFVKQALDDEGAATLKNLQVRKEILSNGGPDIGLVGNPANHANYEKVYNVFLKNGDSKTAYEKLGSIYGRKEKTSTTGQPYAEYYGQWYEKLSKP